MSKAETKTYVAYLRQSTRKQEVSGLGIAAQREIIQSYLKGASILEEYIETETGKRSDRPKLMAALVLCRQSNSILICAKLDRLSRNVAFTSRLLESDVEIIFCDFPEANRLILHIISSIAEYEAQLISERTRQSLKAKKADGVKLGKPENLLNNLNKAIRRSVKTNQDKARNNQNNRRATAFISMMKKDGKTYEQIAEALNKQGFKTSQGCRFHAVQVWRLYRQYLK
jgi:DNA invertase Pin-like site-specific DNA recombinase